MSLNIKKQELAYEKLSKIKAGALFMEAGTGKTKVAIDLIKSKESDIDCVVWIAPASLIKDNSYHQEINKWNRLEKPIYFYSIEGVSASDNKFIEMYNLAKNSKNFCIVDESITIKNTDAGRTKRLLEIYNLFNFRLILNGTPLTKGLIDLYSQIQFISPKILNMTENQFANNFLTYKKEGYKPWKRWSKPENEQALIEIIRPYIFDCDLEIDCFINEKDFEFEQSYAEQSEYQQLKNDYLQGKFEIQFLPMAQKFQHFYTKNQKKEQKLLKLLQDIKIKNEKLIIFCKFIDEINHLKWLGLDFIEYTGNFKEKNAIEKFKNNKDILVCIYGVGSKGLNLQFANNIIFYSQTFDYGNKEQALHRVYRIGQEKQVNIYNFWVKTGLEELIKKSLDKKQNVLSNVKNIISKQEALKL